MHEDNARRVREEHPAFLCVWLLAAGGKRVNSKLAAQLIVVQPPAGAIHSAIARSGRQRFENERCSLTAAGIADYLAGKRKTLLVCALDFRCAGVNTYVCEGTTSAAVYRSWSTGDRSQQHGSIQSFLRLAYARRAPSQARCRLVFCGILRL